jgi:hypothetical protein
MASLERNPKQRAAMQAAIDQVLGGSNITEGATDQGMTTDPNGRWLGGRKIIGGEVFNDWGGGPGGHAGAARFREAQQARVQGSITGVHKNAFIEAARRARAHAPSSAPARSSFMDGSDDLFRLAVFGGQAHKVTGSADVNINLSGFPRHTRTQTSASGLFREVRLNRGRIPAADQGEV